MQALPLLPSAGYTKEERTWAAVAHLAAFAGHIFPFAHIFVPLAVWFWRRDTSVFVDDQGKESVNAQITVTIYAAVCVPFCFILIGFVMLGVLYLAAVILTILAAMAAYEGRVYRYPLILRLVS